MNNAKQATRKLKQDGMRALIHGPAPAAAAVSFQTASFAAAAGRIHKKFLDQSEAEMLRQSMRPQWHPVPDLPQETPTASPQERPPLTSHAFESPPDSGVALCDLAPPGKQDHKPSDAPSQRGVTQRGTRATPASAVSARASLDARAISTSTAGTQVSPGETSNGAGMPCFDHRRGNARYL